jgi:hypothetical protein
MDADAEPGLLDAHRATGEECFQAARHVLGTAATLVIVRHAAER